MKEAYFDWALEMGPHRKREEGKANVLTLGAKGLNPPLSLIILYFVRAVVIVVTVAHVCWCLCRMHGEM